MRILVVIPHYFHPEAGARHSSVDESRRAERLAVVERVLAAWRHGIGGPHAVLDIERKRFEQLNAGQNEVTLVVLTTGGRHLLDEAFCRRHRVNLVDCKVENPRMLGHEFARFFADNLQRFDLFVFSEDDLLVTDPSFVDKARWFSETFGYRRTLMPNRYEWNPEGPAHQTFIDGDLAHRAVARWVDPRPDEEVLAAPALGAPVTFRRARNPHSGMHILTREQVDHWRRQPQWDDKDTGFIGPLESAATLGVLKTFSIYKSWGRAYPFFAVEHLDRRFSAMALPGAQPRPAPAPLAPPEPPARDPA
jgi:hypothetical protein